MGRNSWEDKIEEWICSNVIINKTHFNQHPAFYRKNMNDLSAPPKDINVKTMSTFSCFSSSQTLGLPAFSPSVEDGSNLEDKNTPTGMFCFSKECVCMC